MNIENLNKRWLSLKNDANRMLSGAIKAYGGTYNFVNGGDERLKGGDDLSELGLTLVDAYSYYKGCQGSFYVTSIILNNCDIEFYGVDENNYMRTAKAIRLDHISLEGLLDILESLPEINKI